MGAAEEQELAQLVALVDELIDDAADLRRRWEEVGAILLAEPVPQGVTAPSPGPGEDADPRLLIALDMALSGRSRAEAAEYLRSTFGVEGVDEILAQAFDAG